MKPLLNQKLQFSFAFLASLYYFFYFAGVGVYVIFMPKVLIDIGYSAVEVGVIYAAAPFVRFLLPFVFQHLVVLTSRIYFVSLLFTTLLTFLLFLTSDHFWSYLIANLLFGAAMGVSLPYVETIALSTLSRSHYGKVRLWGSLGFVAIALWLGSVLDVPMEAFYYLSGLAFVTFVFGAMLVRFDTIAHETTASNRSFSLRLYWAFWLSLFLMQVGFGGFYNFFTIYETAQGVSLEVIGWMWGFGVICEVAMLYFQGPLLERNILTILQFATLITAVRWFLLYLFPDSIAMTFVSQSLHAIGFALYHTATISYIFLLYTQKKLAQQFYLGVAFGLGGSVGAIVAGQVYGESLFLAEAIVTLFAGAALFLHQKRKAWMSQDAQQI